MRERAHLEREAVDTAERLAVMEKLLRHLVRLADEESTFRSDLRVVLRARHREPSTFARNGLDRARPAWIELIGSLSRRGGHVPGRVHTDHKLFGTEAGTLPGFAIQIDERPEPARLASDDSDHQRKAERPGTDERSRRSADSEPDRKAVLDGAWVDALPGERRTETSRPLDVLVVTDLQQQIELLREECVVVLEVVAEQREGIDE